MIARERKINLRVAKEVLRLPDWFEAINDDDWREMLDKWKTLVVEARNAGQVERETELNSVKAWIQGQMRKNYARKCPDCGGLKQIKTLRCSACARILKASGLPGARQPQTNMTTNSEIVSLLQRERSELIAQRTAAEAREARILQLDAAIAALSGRSIADAAAPRGPTVVEMVEAAAKALAEKHGKDTVFDHKTLVDIAALAHPESYTQLKRGVYPAVVSLKKRNVIALTQGGFKLNG